MKTILFKEGGKILLLLLLLYIGLARYIGLFLTKPTFGCHKIFIIQITFFFSGSSPTHSVYMYILTVFGVGMHKNMDFINIQWYSRHSLFIGTIMAEIIYK